MIENFELEKVVKTIAKSKTNYVYFFDHLTSPNWISALKEKGFFQEPPLAERGEGFIQFPFWPESRYLNRVAEFAPEEVLEIALNLSSTENVRVHEDFAEAACKMPHDLAVKWAEKESVWLSSQEHFYLNLPYHIADLIEYLTKNGKPESALLLADALFSISPDPNVDEELKKEEDQRLKDGEFFFPYRPKPQTKFNQDTYGRILRKKVPTFLEKSGINTFDWLCHLLSHSIELGLRSDDSKSHSRIWRPAIEDHEQNLGMDFRDHIIIAIRTSAEKMINSDLNNIEDILERLFNKDQLRFTIFRRIAFHIIRLFPENQEGRISICLKDKAYFEETELYHEYRLLVKEQFGVLDENDQNEILGWILEKEESRVKGFIDMYKDEHNKMPSDTETRNYTYAWLRTALAPFSNYLHGDLKSRYQKAVKEVGEAEHPEFLTYMKGGSYGATSPKSSKDILAMTTDDLVKYLIEWQPKGEWLSDSRDGVSAAISEAVEKNPHKYVDDSERFKALHPKYIRGFIEGFHSATRNNKEFLWEPVLNLCQWVAEQPREYSQKILDSSKGDDREEKNWGWTRKRIVNLIEDGVREDRKSAIPFGFKEKVWSIIKTLTNDPEPSPENEKEMIQPFDPATTSINTVRGDAMHTVMHYTMWCKRNHEKQESDSDDSIFDFSIVPEVKELLELHLDPEHEKTLTIRSVYGRWFPYFVVWDENWAKENTDKIFLIDEANSELWDVAWGTYLVFNRAYDNAFSLLGKNYERSLGHLGSLGRGIMGGISSDERLAEHLMTFYWRGIIEKDTGSLVEKFFMVADDELRSYALKYMGESLKSTIGDIPDEVLTRFRELWEWRIVVAKESEQTSDYLQELAAIGIWFESNKFDDNWALGQLLKVLNITKKVEASEEMMEKLASMAEDNPPLVIKCFQFIVEGDPDGYQMFVWRDPSIELLRNVINSEDQVAKEKAIELIHRLGAMGHLEYRDLLSEK